MWAKSPTLIENSTIAFNVVAYGSGAGIYMDAPLVLRNSIVASNSGMYGFPRDVSGSGLAVVTASNNLVTSSTLLLPIEH